MQKKPARLYSLGTKFKQGEIHEYTKDAETNVYRGIGVGLMG